MLRTRIPFVLGALAAIAVTADAQPPQFEPPQPRAVILNLIDYVGDKNLTAELKLNDDQLKKLTDHRKKDWDAEYTTVPEEFRKTFAARNKAIVALFKEVLTPEQYTRATQLTAQDALRSYGRGFGGGFGPGAPPAPPINLVRVSAATLRLYPEIADAVKLTDEQKKIVESATRGGGGFGGGPGGGGGFGGPFRITEPRVVLTPDQTEALKKFLGTLSTQRFAPSFDERGDVIRYGGRGFSGDSLLDVLVNRPVQTELKLTEEQINTISDLQRKSELFYSEELITLSPEKAVAKEKELTAEIEKAVAKLLNKEQGTRVKQIQIWMQIGPGTDAISRYQFPPIATGIGLSDEQRKELAAANTAYWEETLKAFEGDEAIDVLKKKLAAAAETRVATVERIITTDQKAKLKDLLGAEFRDPRYAGGGGLGGGDVNEILKRLRTASFGRYSTELTLLSNNQAMKDDLKLAEAQVKKLQEAVVAYREKFGPGGGFISNQTQEEADKGATERHEFVEKSLKDILTVEQQKRFRELIIQYREHLVSLGMSGAGTTTATVGIPGVAGDIKINAEQKKKLLDGTDPSEVLTGDQKTMLKKLAGEPMKGEFNTPFKGGGPGGPRPQPSARVALLDAAAINPELKLTAEQEYKVALALEAYATQLREFTRVPGGPKLDAAAMRKAQEESLATYEKAIDAVLTAEQKTRLAQLEVQSLATNLTTAFARPAVAAKLALTADQKTKLDAIRADYRERSQLVSSLSSRDFGRFAGPGAPFPLVKVREKARERMLAVLTEPQKAAWKELIGEPSKVPLTNPFSGPFGGPRGPGGIDP